MRDEEFIFASDSREKKNIARSARNRRTHNGKCGGVKFPSDYKTRKELNAMNGECKTYRLNDPMQWGEFKTMPDDIKILYIGAIREKYHASIGAISEMLGVRRETLSKEMKRLGIAVGNADKSHVGWDKKAFRAWAFGEENPSTVEIPVKEKPPVREETPATEEMTESKETPEESEEIISDDTESKVPVTLHIITNNERYMIERALGILQGISYAAESCLASGILEAVGMIENALHVEG